MSGFTRGRTGLFRQVRSFATILGAARACAAAAEAGHTPAPRDLAALGIDPEAFRGVRMR